MISCTHTYCISTQSLNGAQAGDFGRVHFRGVAFLTMFDKMVRYQILNYLNGGKVYLRDYSCVQRPTLLYIQNVIEVKKNKARWSTTDGIVSKIVVSRHVLKHY